MSLGLAHHHCGRGTVNKHEGVPQGPRILQSYLPSRAIAECIQTLLEVNVCMTVSSLCILLLPKTWHYVSFYQSYQDVWMCIVTKSQYDTNH